MRSLLDLTSKSYVSESEVMRFCSETHTRCFDFVFGKYSRYGTSQMKPNVGETTSMQADHLVCLWGEGIDDDAVGDFTRRGYT